MKISAPYNFVPLSAWVYEPDWADQVSQEIPFKHGINGCLELELENHTPLLIGGEQKSATDDAPGEVHFKRLPDGQLAIPGSSIRGMCRNVLEIASFGKMAFVDDQRLSIRDLTPGTKKIYRDRMTHKDLTPKSKAGILKPTGDKDDFCWELTPCDFVRVDHQELVDWARTLDIKAPNVIKKRGSAPNKYKIWGDHLAVSFDLPKMRPGVRAKTVTPEHMKAFNLGSGRLKGRLVFTGQPQDNKPGKKRQKHLEFIFHNEKTAQHVPEQVMTDFLRIHEESEEYKYWQKRLKDGIPVFYHEEAGTPVAIGLAMMFRLPYAHSIGETIDYTSEKHRQSNKDLAELLFGIVGDDDRGLKGRVNFGLARLITEEKILDINPVILNGPKASYYPAYVKQKHTEQGRLIGDGYQTYMDDRSEISGWKRYPARPEYGGLVTDGTLQRQSRERNGINYKVLSKLFPLASHAKFQFKMRIHNLKREELGALIWCLTWGGQEDYFHGLGMGKPFGFGRVRLRIKPESWQKLYGNGGEVPSQAECMASFCELMEKSYGKTAAIFGKEAKWSESEQITQLLAMADPSKAPGLPGSNNYMPLEDFLKNKGQKMAEPKLVLLPYVGFDGQKDHEIFPRLSAEKWEAREKAYQKAKEEEEKMAKELAQLDPLSAEVRKELKTKQAEERAGYWLAQLEQRSPEEAKLIAEELIAFYKDEGKWSGKQSKKQTAKNETIKNYLES